MAFASTVKQQGGNLNPHIRTAAAAIALAHSLERLVIGVYKYETHAYHRISVSVRDDRVCGYDYISHCYVSGKLPHLYHQGEQSYFTLMPSGSMVYSGFDHDTSSSFSINVMHRKAHMLDHNADSYFAYSVR
ncbi:hypothetical protein [Bradyrhizobium sp. CCGB01]|uniref:hypothetical protein n=1 Tax=Bradyrhizobium sp. CCGB01 TaxID=2949634 RepID=UPI0020B3E063|nr:hypothetical protein [Bradyrhizobium sp. CCGB01]MCP3405546.1 hypothetical protein [Bradyrhizobium sp. CCGB01]